MKKILLLSLIISFIGLLTYVNFKKGDKVLKENQNKEFINNVYYEIKKCFLFKKYCFFTSPRNYYNLKNNNADFKIDNECLYKNKCEGLTDKELKWMSYQKKQSVRLKKIENYLNKLNCNNDSDKKLFKFINYLSFSSSLIEKRHKTELFFNINLKKQLNEYLVKLDNCSN